MTPSKLRLARPFLLAGALTALAGAAAAASAPAASPGAVARASLEAFNRGDTAAFEASLAPEMAIIDNFAPHEWHGAGAYKAWSSDYETWAKADAITDGKLSNLSVTRSQVDGDSAYVVVKADFTFRKHGRRMIEPGEQAMSLHHGDDGWKITGWGWSGAVPHAVVAKPKTPAAATPAAAAPAKP